MSLLTFNAKAGDLMVSNAVEYWVYRFFWGIRQGMGLDPSIKIFISPK